MSSLATSNTGMVATAREFREQFLKFGTKHESFSCPFCGVALHDKCIYTECKKSAHFSLPQKQFHEEWCERFEVDVVGPPASTPGKISATRVLFRDVDLPEALVARRVRRLALSVPGSPSWKPLDAVSAGGVKAKLKGAALPQRQTTSLLRDVANAYDDAIGRVRSAAAEEGISGSAYWRRVNETLSEFPLNLYREQLNYSTAFRSPTGIVPGRERIYHGRRGIVELQGPHLVIRELPKDASRPLDGHPTSPLFLVLVPPTASDEPAWQESFRACLHRWSEDRRLLRWFAYGCPQADEREVRLAPISMDALYAFPS